MMETGPDVIGPINLGNPAEFTVCELAEELIGSCSKIVHRPLPQDDPQKKRRPDMSEVESACLASCYLPQRRAHQDHSLF